MAGQKKISTGITGVRYIQSKTKKVGPIKYDREYYIRYKNNGKLIEESIGWSSAGITPAKASAIREEIVNNIRLGKYPQSVKEMREAGEEQKQQEEREQQEREKKSILFGKFFREQYFPSAKLKISKGSLDAESALFKKWIEPVIGETPLVELNYGLVKQILIRMKESGRAPASQKYALAIISQVWSYAKSLDIIEGDCPIKKFSIKLDNERGRYLTEEEAKMLLDELKKRSLDTYDMCMFSLYCGMRSGEICKLKWADINYSDNTILIRHPKSGHSRFAFIIPEIAEILRRRDYPGKSMNDYVIPSTNGKEKLRISKLFFRCVEELGLNEGITDPKQKVVFHTLRHTHASWLVQKSVSLYEVKELMGHSQFRMTQRYAHLSQDGLRKAVSVLSASQPVENAATDTCTDDNNSDLS